MEVKGPRDRLSHQQRFWLAHMAAGTISVEVCKVKEPHLAGGGGGGAKAASVSSGKRKSAGSGGA